MTNLKSWSESIPDMYKIDLKYRTPRSAFFDKNDFYFDLYPPKHKINEGDPFEVKAIVKNLSKRDLPIPVAIVGYSPGVIPNKNHLESLIKDGLLSTYDVGENELYLYWVDLESMSTLRFPLYFKTYYSHSYTDSGRFADEEKTDHPWSEGGEVTVLRSIKQIEE